MCEELNLRNTKRKNNIMGLGAKYGDKEKSYPQSVW